VTTTSRPYPSGPALRPRRPATPPGADAAEQELIRLTAPLIALPGLTARLEPLRAAIGGACTALRPGLRDPPAGEPLGPGQPPQAGPVRGRVRARDRPRAVHPPVTQAARWFFGPARAIRYLHDPATRRNWRSAVMAASALGSAAEWIGCAVVPALACVLLAAGPAPVRAAAAGFAAVCAAQVALTEAWLGAPGRARTRLARVLAFPLACAVHGAGGIAGAARLLAGGTGTGKTERGPGT
jgi:hypothetical protein